MSQNKLVLIVLLVCCVSNVSAWGSEVAIAGNETCDYGFSFLYNDTSIDNPHVYDREQTLMSPNMRSNDAVTFCTTFKIWKKVWDGSSYVNDSSCYHYITSCVDLVYNLDVDGVGYYSMDSTTQQQMTDGYLVKRYFQDMLNSGNIACAEYNNTDETDKPDIFVFDALVDVGNDDLNQVYSGAISLNEDGENELKQDHYDYGFEFDGHTGNSEGAIFTSVGWGSGVSTAGSDMEHFFHLIFYGLIPVLFILAIFKMMGRVS